MIKGYPHTQKRNIKDFYNIHIGAKSLSNSILVYIFLKSKISFPSSPIPMTKNFIAKKVSISSFRNPE